MTEAERMSSPNSNQSVEPHLRLASTSRLGSASVSRIRFEQVVKRFGAFVALDGVSCTVEPGTVHAFLGENGAGKTTLMRLLAGVTTPSSGRILLDDREERVRSVRCARRLGIGMVHQHFSLQPSLTVLENIALAEPGAFVLRRGELARRIQETSAATGIEVRPQALVAELSYAERQRVEILRLLMWGVQTIILDEPTSLLSGEEAERILTEVRDLARSGRTILLVTHKLREVRKFADTVTVLRQGRMVGTVAAADTDEMRLAEMMFGQQVRRSVEVGRRTAGERVLQVRGVHLSGRFGTPSLSNVSFEARRGEVLGIGGAAGNGQDALMEVLFGLRKVDVGSIDWFLEGGLAAHSPDAVAYIPADRLGLGVSPSVSVWENLILRRYRHRPLSVAGLINRRKVLDTAAEMAAVGMLPPDSLSRQAGQLSGGNVQRLILGRELWGNPQVILAEEPSHGLDLAGVSLVHQVLLAHAARGAVVIIVSSDLDELHALSDRILVMYRGGVTEFTSTGPQDATLSPAMALAGLVEGARGGPRANGRTA